MIFNIHYLFPRVCNENCGASSGKYACLSEVLPRNSEGPLVLRLHASSPSSAMYDMKWGGLGIRSYFCKQEFCHLQDWGWSDPHGDVDSAVQIINFRKALGEGIGAQVESWWWCSLSILGSEQPLTSRVRSDSYWKSKRLSIIWLVLLAPYGVGVAI